MKTKRKKFKSLLAIIMTLSLLIPFINTPTVFADGVITINYDGDNGNSVGLTSGGTFEVAAKYPASMLTSYQGSTLTSVRYYVNASLPITIKIFSGTTNNTPAFLLYSKNVVTVAGWNTFVLDSQITVASTDLWVGYEVTHAAGQYPAGIDDGPANIDGCYIRSDALNGGTWDRLSNIGFNTNWNIRADLILDDDVDPTISNFQINSNASLTNSKDVTLSQSATDDKTTVSSLKMRFSNDNSTWSDWEAFSNTKSWTLTDVDGEQPVYFQVKDLAGNTASTSASIILDKTAPALSSSVPTDNSTNFNGKNNLIVTFTENISASSKVNDITLLDSNNNPIEYTIQFDNKNMIINPKNDLSEVSDYTLNIPVDALKDGAQNSNINLYKISFKTADLTAPKLVKSTPENQTTIFPRKDNLVLTFSENIAAGSNIDNLELLDSKGNKLEYIYEIKNNTLIINPKNDLVQNSYYILKMPANSVEDASGNLNAEAQTIEFATLKEESTTPKTGDNGILLYFMVFLAAGGTLSLRIAKKQI